MKEKVNKIKKTPMKSMISKKIKVTSQTPSAKSKIILGMKGQAGSGKDTVANYLVKKHGFTRIAFADPLKEICAIISGWPLEMLRGDTAESRIFRETVVHPDFGMTARQLLQFVGI